MSARGVRVLLPLYTVMFVGFLEALSRAPGREAWASPDVPARRGGVRRRLGGVRGCALEQARALVTQVEAEGWAGSAAPIAVSY